MRLLLFLRIKMLRFSLLSYLPFSSPNAPIMLIVLRERSLLSTPPRLPYKRAEKMSPQPLTPALSFVAGRGSLQHKDGFLLTTARMIGGDLRAGKRGELRRRKSGSMRCCRYTIFRSLALCPAPHPSPLPRSGEREYRKTSLFTCWFFPVSLLV